MIAVAVAVAVAVVACRPCLHCRCNECDPN